MHSLDLQSVEPKVNAALVKTNTDQLQYSKSYLRVQSVVQRLTRIIIIIGEQGDHGKLIGASPTLIGFMYVCAYVCSNTSSTCSSCVRKAHIACVQIMCSSRVRAVNIEAQIRRSNYSPAAI